MFIDGLKEGENTISLPNVHGELAAMNPELGIANEVTEHGLILTVKNYSSDMYAVGLKGINLEDK